LFQNKRVVIVSFFDSKFLSQWRRNNFEECFVSGYFVFMANENRFKSRNILRFDFSSSLNFEKSTLVSK
jgi:hypothetical protein